MFDNVKRQLIREFGVLRGDRLIQAYETATFLTQWIRSGTAMSFVVQR